MKHTKEHTFGQPEITDDIVKSIETYAENFLKIDNLIQKSVPNLNLHLIVGKRYDRGLIFYNRIPVIGGHIGWVNLNDGVYAPTWKKNTNYLVNDIVTPNPSNGYYYRCIVDGTSSPLSPTFLTEKDAVVDDIYGLLSWIPSKPYSVGDIVKKTSGGSTYYYRCTIAGTTDTDEPDWNDVAGRTIIDGSVSWMVCKKATWQRVDTASEFRPFGKIE